MATNRRRFLAGAAAAVPTLGSASILKNKAPSASQPDLVILMTDDQEVSDPRLTPSINRYLVKKGTAFSCYCDMPLCAPSRATFFTGMSAHNHGVLSNGGRNHGPGGYWTYRQYENQSLMVALQNAGYAVWYFGKYINQYSHADPTHVPPGVDEWCAIATYDETAYTDFVLNENGSLVTYDNGEYITDTLRDKITQLIGANTGTRPLAIIICTSAPHLPAYPAPRDVGVLAGVPMPQLRYGNFNEKDVSDKPTPIRDLPLLSRREIERQQEIWETKHECMLAVDTLLNAVHSSMRAAGRAESAYWFQFADNGFQYGEHRMTDHFGKDSYYTDGARVPLYVAGPGIAEGAVCPALVSSLDIPATILELAGAAWPAGVTADGQSLTPLFVDFGAPWRTGLLVQDDMAISIRTADYTWAEWPDSGEYELYIFDQDRWQDRNKAAAGKYSTQKSQLAAALATLKTGAGPTMWCTASFTPP